jgi:glutaredoxin-like protein
VSLIAPADQEKLRDAFSALSRPVQLLFFTQTLGCETCLQTRQILDELPLLSDKIAVEEVNFVLDKDKVSQYAVDRVPAIAVTYGDDGARQDSRIRFLGAPAGYDFMALVDAILAISGASDSELSAESLALVAGVTTPTNIQVFVTPTCAYCPRAVGLANRMAAANPNITATTVQATEFYDLASRFRVTGVPKTVVNEQIEILGALPEPDFIRAALAIED